MPENALKKFEMKSRQMLRSAITSTWILFLFAFLGFIAVISMTAFQLQHQIRSTTIENRELTLWEVSRIYEKWTTSKKTLEAHQKRLQSALEKQAKLHTEVEKTKEERALSGILIDESAYYIVKKSRDFVEIPDSALNCNTDYGDDNSCQDVIRKFQLDSLPIIDENYNNIVSDYYLNIRNSKYINFIYDDNLEKERFIQNEIKSINDKIDEYSNELDSILKSENTSISFNMGDFLDAKRFLQGVEDYWLIPDFSIMPPDMLTLFLVMAMGGLGGAIHLSQLYLRQLNDSSSTNETYNARYFLLRPFLGAITAIAVFILTKAGVLIIAAGDGRGAAVSPFFVAFLGIISGLLADRALLMIQNAGHRVFSDTEDRKVDRWAYGLKTALEAMPGDFEKNKEALARSLEVPVQKVDNWLAENEAVQEDTQRDISLFTHQSKGLLFRDLKA